MNMPTSTQLAFALVVVGVTVAYLWKRKTKYISPYSLNYEKDMVYLHMFPRKYGKHVPNISPFAIKMETWLRLHNIKYQVVETRKFSKKGQIPYIFFNGEEMADSNISMEHLRQHFNIDKGEGLTVQEQAVSRAFLKMLEENTTWTYFLFRYVWLIDDFLKFFRVVDLPWPLSRLIEKKIGKKLLKRAHAHGIGRHSPTEIGEIGKDDIRAISQYLGDNSYFHGDNPTLIDCALFGHMSQIVYVDIPFPHKQVLERECRNVVDLIDRLKEKLWPDWNDVVDQSVFI